MKLVPKQHLLRPQAYERQLAIRVSSVWNGELPALCPLLLRHTPQVPNKGHTAYHAAYNAIAEHKE